MRVEISAVLASDIALRDIRGLGATSASSGDLGELGEVRSQHLLIPSGYFVRLA